MPFLAVWQLLTSDPWVLEIVKVKPPPLTCVRYKTPLPHMEEKHLALWEEISSLLAKGAIGVVE